MISGDRAAKTLCNFLCTVQRCASEIKVSPLYYYIIYIIQLLLLLYKKIGIAQLGESGCFMGESGCSKGESGCAMSV